jgi:hypothetical protein
MNNGKFKQITGVILGVFALLGAAWGIDKRYATREVTELWLADMQKQMIIIQKNQRTGAAQQQLWYWQQKVEEKTRTYARNTADRQAQQDLTDAKKQRDYWQREVHKLMNQ